MSARLVRSRAARQVRRGDQGRVPAASIGVAEPALGVQPVAQRDELGEPRVGPGQVRRVPGVHLAPVRPPARRRHDGLDVGEILLARCRVVRRGWRCTRCPARRRSTARRRPPGSTRTSIGKLIRQSRRAEQRAHLAEHAGQRRARDRVLLLLEPDPARAGEDPVGGVGVAAGAERPGRDRVDRRDRRRAPAGRAGRSTPNTVFDRNSSSSRYRQPGERPGRPVGCGCSAWSGSPRCAGTSRTRSARSRRSARPGRSMTSRPAHRLLARLEQEGGHHAGRSRR